MADASGLDSDDFVIPREARDPQSGTKCRSLTTFGMTNLQMQIPRPLTSFGLLEVARGTSVLLWE